MQPIIIAEENIEEWQQQTFMKDGKEYSKQVLPFPSEKNPRFYFGCDSSEFPYPGVVINKRENKDEFPVLPCCFKENQLSITSRSSITRNYFSGKPIFKDSIDLNRSSHIIAEKQVLETEKLGKIPTVIYDLVQTKNLLSQEDKLLRLGVPESPNSLIHCVVRALAKDTKYINSLSITHRDEYIKNLRVTISKEPETYYAILCKQENYDKSISQIQSNLENPKVYFNSTLYYRMLEEHFNIRIYVFVRNGNNTELEFPRNKLFHTSPFYDRSVVLIYKHMGIEADGLIYPQNELIVILRNDKLVTTFNSMEYKYLFNRLYRVSQGIVTWNYSIPQTDESINLDASVNIYSRTNFMTKFGNMIKSQIIDEYGKVIAFNIIPKKKIFTVFIPPTQPLNLPMVNDIFSTKIDVATKTFGKPSFVVNIGKHIMGLWFRTTDLS